MMMNKAKRIGLILLPGLCIFVTYLIIRHESKLSSWVFYFAPLVSSSLLIFILSILFDVENDYKVFIGILISASTMYLVLFAAEPLVFRYDPFFFVGICGWVLPLAFAGLIANIYVFWLGSLIRKKIYKDKLPFNKDQ